MGKSGGKVPPVNTGQLANIMQQQVNLANEEFQYGKGRTERYTDPVLNEFARILGFGPSAAPATGTGGAQGLDVTQTTPFSSILSSSMMQLPVQATQQSYDAMVRQIKDQVPPGPQQNALLADAQNKRMQGLGTGAYGLVNNMLNSLTGQANQWSTGAGLANQGLSGAASTAGTIAQIQQQNQQLQLAAQQSGNQMLGGIFQSIGTLGGFALGGWAGSPSGSSAITGMLGL